MTRRATASVCLSGFVALSMLASACSGESFGSSASAGAAGASAGAPPADGGGSGGTSSGGTSSGGTSSGGTSSGGTGGTSAVCPAGGIQDLASDFASGPIDTSVWSLYSPSGGTATVSAGKLVLAPTLSSGNYVAIYTKQSFSLTGCAAWVEVVQPIGAGETAFMVQVSSSLDVEFMTLPNPTSPSGHDIVFSVEENGVEDNQKAAYDPSAHRWWRFRFVGNQVAFDTSPDGKAWTERRLATRPSGLDPARVELGAGTFAASNNPQQAVFDNLNVSP